MLEQAMEVLGLFTMTRRELGLADVARLLDRPKSTVSGWLSAMHEAGLLDRAGGPGRYRLGIRLTALGELAKHSTTLQDVAQPLLGQLARRTRETASVNVLIGTDVVNAMVVESPLPIRGAGGVGIPLPIHATAAGKVLVAWRPPEEARHLLPLRFHLFTPATIPDAATFLEHLAEVRAKGYAVADREMAPDLCALSAPVRDASREVVAAISVAAPSSRVEGSRIPALLEEIVETASEVSRLLGYVGESGDAAV